MEPRISVIIPLFNESQNVRPLYAKLADVLERSGLSYEIIFVDDGSTDGTGPITEEIHRADPKVVVIQFHRNFGQTAALSAGFDAARGRIIVPMDGDMQNDPEDIPALLERIDEGYDVVSGWRRKRKDSLLRRRIPSILANAIISRISGVRLHDYGCTLKAYRTGVIQDIRLYGEMHRFIPIYAAWRGGRVTEMEVRHHPRVWGRSKYGLMRTFIVILDLILIKFLGSYQTKPIHVFGSFGILSLLGSVGAGTLAVFYKLSGQKDFVETPLPLLTVLMFLVGFLSIFMGLLAEIMMRTYYESQDKPTYLIKDVLRHEQD
ncbi:glycosyltransferase family 2 protein [Thermodesulfobacteriota bacterium]